MGQPIPIRDTDGHLTGYDREDPFPCASWCGDDRGLRQDLQDARHCTLRSYRGTHRPGVPDDGRFSLWLGRLPIAGHRRPTEDPNDGCPGGWSRCGFVESVYPYLRRRVEGGGHDANPLTHAATDRLVLEAVRYFEQHEAQAAAEFRRLCRG